MKIEIETKNNICNSFKINDRKLAKGISAINIYIEAGEPIKIDAYTNETYEKDSIYYTDYINLHNYKPKRRNIISRKIQEYKVRKEIKKLFEDE